MDTRVEDLSNSYVIARGWTMCAAVLLAGLIGLTGCSPDQQDPDADGGWTLDDDAATDAGQDTEPDVDPPDEPVSTTFRLANEGDQSIRVQISKQCTNPTPAWLGLMNIGGKAGTGPCPCKCKSLEAGEPCPVCDIACQPPEVQEVPAGESIEWGWSGRTHVQDEVDNRSCTRPRIPERGTTMQAEFCWTGASGPTGQDVELSETTCETVEFEYGQETVGHDVETDAEQGPHPTEFVLQNASGERLGVVEPSICNLPDDPWVSIERDGTRIDFETDCSVCSCEEARQNECSVCERRCADPRPVAMDVGATRTIEWDGVGHEQGRESDSLCHEEIVPEAGDELTAKFCWRPDPRRPGEVDPVCVEKSFNYGEAQVKQVIGGPDEPADTTIRLENDTGGSIRIQEVGDNCGLVSPGWLSATYNDAALQLATQCRDCACQALRERGRCGDCVGPPCENPRVEELAAGESTEWTWPGYVYTRDEVDGKRCLEEGSPTPGQSFEFRYCWSESEGPTGSGETLQDGKCEIKQELYTGSERTVVLTAR